eukprot:3570271-Prymnesium_polylepis.2
MQSPAHGVEFPCAQVRILQQVELPPLEGGVSRSSQPVWSPSIAKPCTAESRRPSPAPPSGSRLARPLPVWPVAPLCCARHAQPRQHHQVLQVLDLLWDAELTELRGLPVVAHRHPRHVRLPTP